MMESDVTYITPDDALKLIKRILSNVAYDLEEDDYVLIEDDGVVIGKPDDFDEDVILCAIPAVELIEFTDDTNFTIDDQRILNAINDLF